jgi:surface carbohydrate biosynthesis protein
MKAVTKIETFYRVYIKPKKIWKKPPRAEIMIYDQDGAEALEIYTQFYRVAIMAIRGESINVPCVLRAALNFRFWSGDALKTYMDSYIALVKPKVIITFIDNDVRFYEISKRFSDIKTIFVQNGRRTELGDVFGAISKNEKYFVDYMLVFGNAIGREFLRYVSGEVIPIGSLKNNSVSRTEQFYRDTVLFVSTWEPEPGGSKPLLRKKDGVSISWNDYFSPEEPILEFLDDWCISRDKTLIICGRSFDFANDEREFFRKYIKKSNWTFLPRGEIYSTYHRIDSSAIVVFIESTCGYESLSRGKRTAALTCRGEKILVSTEKFGWPANLPENGPFWTNQADPNRFREILDFLDSVNDYEWESIRNSFMPEIMEFDVGNQKLEKLLFKLLRTDTEISDSNK